LPHHWEIYSNPLSPSESPYLKDRHRLLSEAARSDNAALG
jgi:hypothetical protein